MLRDPVCDMQVDETKAKHIAAHAGETYYFCSHGCRARFEADPNQYLNAHIEHQRPDDTSDKASSTDEALEKDVYFCPMHPYITAKAPGKCPECGMKLDLMQTEKGIGRKQGSGDTLKDFKT